MSSGIVDATPITLGLIDYPRPYTDDRDVTVLQGRNVDLVDVETLRPVKGHSGWAWVSGKQLLASCSVDLFQPEHIDPSLSYVVMAYQVDTATTFDKDPYK